MRLLILAALLFLTSLYWAKGPHSVDPKSASQSVDKLIAGKR